jgi:hypothetical protein
MCSTSVLHVGFEGTNRGYLTQSYSSEQHDYALTNEGLQIHKLKMANS